MAAKVNIPLVENGYSVNVISNNGNITISLKEYVRPARQPAFTRFNVFLRDRFTCQYCGSHDELTFDHVIPRSKGGATTWENVSRGPGR